MESQKKVSVQDPIVAIDIQYSIFSCICTSTFQFVAFRRRKIFWPTWCWTLTALHSSLPHLWPDPQINSGCAQIGLAKIKSLYTWWIWQKVNFELNSKWMEFKITQKNGRIKHTRMNQIYKWQTNQIRLQLCQQRDRNYGGQCTARTKAVIKY